MTRMTEEERGRWIPALAGRIRGPVAATARSSRARAAVAGPSPRDLPPAATEDR